MTDCVAGGIFRASKVFGRGAAKPFGEWGGDGLEGQIKLKDCLFVRSFCCSYRLNCFKNNSISRDLHL